MYLSLIEWIQFFNKIVLDKISRREVYNYFLIDNKHTSFNMCVSY
nr:MAG TPA: hypothetical protein [Caudoviricetes sp.]